MSEEQELQSWKAFCLGSSSSCLSCLYREAIYLGGLRPTGSVRRRLRRLNSRIKRTERKLDERWECVR